MYAADMKYLADLEANPPLVPQVGQPWPSVQSTPV
jgi:hypothetical protein